MVGVVGIIAVVAIVIGIVVLQLQRKPSSQSQAQQAQTTPPPAAHQDTGGLQSTDEEVGTGAEAVSGKKVSVNYVGTLTNGTKFDSSYDRNQPFSFTLGAGEVIKGWDQGVAGMKVGGKRKLVIPPDLGYGAQAQSSIPANSTLVFEVELLGVQ